MAGKKTYPGGLERYTELREARLEAEKNNQPPDPFLILAEEAAGLCYILDGIRFNTRRARG